MNDYLFRYPFQETGKGHLERYVNAAIQANFAIVWLKINVATAGKHGKLTVSGKI